MTTPVVRLAENVPLKFVEVETLILIVLAGGADGVIIVSPLRLTEVSG